MTQTDSQHNAPAGVLNLYKPVGRSSAHYVYRLRPIFGIRKVGHAGTLDPFADGVLLACVGKATRLVERLMGLPKHYRTTLRLGVTNETFDPERPFEAVSDARQPEEAEIRRVLSGFVGRIEQRPPTFSAIRVGGVQAYEYARKGRPVELAARTVRIDRIDLVAYDWPSLTLDVHCGKGTYIRSLARDVGAALACGACCETLTRCGIGPFRMDQAVRLDAGEEAVRGALLSIDKVMELIGPFSATVD